MRITFQMTIRQLAERWRSSDIFRGYAWATAKKYSCELDRIVAQWGGVPLTVFGDRRITAKILQWRDRRSMTPRAADEGIRVLRQLLSFAYDEGLIPFDPTTGIGEFGCQSDRLLTFWSDDDIAAFVFEAVNIGMPRCGEAVRLIAETGIGLTDALTIQWRHVGEYTVTRPDPGPRKRQRTKTKLPRLPGLSKVLEDLRCVGRQDGVSHLLVNERGIPWRRSTLHKHIDQVRKAAGIIDVDPISGNRQSKRVQDLRNTYLLRLMETGKFSDHEISAMINRPIEQIRALRTAAM